MEAFRVSHKHSGDRFYVLAASASEAIELVTLALGDTEGGSAWTADRDTPSYGLSKGVILDASGKPIKKVDA